MPPVVRSAEPSRTPASAPPRRIVVRFRDTVYLPYVDAIEHHFIQDLAAAWAQVRQEFPGIHLKPLFTSLTPRQIESFESRAAVVNPKRARRLTSYFAVDCPAGHDPAILRERLAGLPHVDKAYVQGGPTPPPSITLDALPQGHLEAAPDGVGAEKVWGAYAGADGTGIHFVDVEQGWTLDHKDLVDSDGNRLVKLIGGENYDYQGHGTAVLGLLMAADNDFFCVGIAPGATGSVVSTHWESSDPAIPDWRIPDALLAAANALSAGDVLLIEAQAEVEVTDKKGVKTTVSGFPVEVEDASYDVLVDATLAGIVVVEAAGNAGEDLDAFRFGGLQLLNPSSPDFRDSGAILVAGGRLDPSRPAGTVRYVALSGGTNYGSRVDCYAHGEGVTTVGSTLYRWSEPLDSSSTDFSGTSSASAIVAGAAIVTQGMVRARSGSRLDPDTLRQLLGDETKGTPSASGKAVDRIGVMPNLEALAAGLPDVYLRDHPLDDGDPHSGPLSVSPDIIVRGSPANPADFGEGSGHEDDPALSENVTAGKDHYVYLRVKNRGGADATNVQAKVYWSECASLVTPALWNLIGSVAIGSVASTDKLVVSPAIVWPAAAIPASGHYCFVAMVGDDLDPFPPTDALTDWDSYLTLIRDVNNITWRNFNVVDASTTATEMLLPFLLVGPMGRGARMRLELIVGDPEAELQLEAPPRILGAMGLRDIERVVDRDGEYGRARAGARGRLRLPEFHFPANLRARCGLRIRLGHAEHAPLWHLTLRQIHGKQEVGRITWRIRRRSRHL